VFKLTPPSLAQKEKYNFSTRKKKYIKITPRLAARNDVKNIIKEKKAKNVLEMEKIRNYFGTARHIFY